MTEWSIIWHNLPPLWVVILVIAPIVLIGTYLIYRKESHSVPPTTKILLTLLRCLVIFIILAILFKPVLLIEKAIERESYLIVLIDESLSMSFKDKFTEPTQRTKLGLVTGLYSKGENLTADKERQLDEMKRIDLINRVLSNTQFDILGDLSKNYTLKTYTFAGTLKGNAEIGAVQASGNTTALGNALGEAVNDLAGHPITGIILISDGQNNAGIEPLDAIRRLIDRDSIPIYAVAAGNPLEPKDIKLLELQAPEVAIAKDPILFVFAVKSQGLEGETVSVSLTEDNHLVTEETIQLIGQNQKQSVTLKYTPSQAGEYLYTIRIPVQPGETIKENNILQHHLKVVDEKIKVLYIERLPRWEYRYLKNALMRDHSIKMQCLLLDADQEFPQESSTGMPPLTQFPADKKKLFDYDVIIYGDVDPRLIRTALIDSEQIINNLVSFVEEMGGGIAFIAGAQYNPRSFRRTVLAELLPVVLEDQELRIATHNETIKEAFTLKLTPEGIEDPIMRLEADPQVNLELWEDRDQRRDGLPGLLWYYPIKKSKPGAKSLAVHPYSTNQFGPRPIFASQYYGRGRVFFSATDETWRWRFLRGDKYFYAFWSEVIRYLRGGRLVGSKRYNLFVDKPKYSLGEKTKISARVYDVEFQPLETPSLPVHLELPNNLKKELELTPVTKKAGHYECVYKPTEMGNYRAWIGPTEIGKEKERTYVSFVVQFPVREYENPLVDTKTLQLIAEKTGGVFLPIYQINELPEHIKQSGEIIFTESTEKDLWDSPWVFLLFLTAIGLEWIIRKLVRLI